MNKKAFSIIELISVIIILIVLVIIIFPYFNKNSNDESKKELYIKEVNNIVVKAKQMYENEENLKNKDLFTKLSDDIYTISLSNIEEITDYKDPFGYVYDKDKTVISFVKSKDKDKKYTIVVDVVSCNQDANKDSNDCYEIVNVAYDLLSPGAIKKTNH